MSDTNDIDDADDGNEEEEAQPVKRQTRAAEIIVEVGEWATIEQLDDKFQEEGFFSDEELLKATQHYRRSKIRHYMEKMRKADGSRIYHNLDVKADDGTIERRYKQADLFNLEDYRKVIHYRGTRWRKEYKELRRLIKEARGKFGKQTEFVY